jgi:hypothetical protein
MGWGIRSFALGAVVLAAGCSGEAPAPVRNETVRQAVPSPTPVAVSPLAQWLVGSWSVDKSCATDFMAHYNADGSLRYGKDSGHWTLAGDTVTETITERMATDADAAAKLPEPETRTYTVARTDAGHGVITFEGRKIPIQRC